MTIDKIQCALNEAAYRHVMEQHASVKGTVKVSFPTYALNDFGRPVSIGEEIEREVKVYDPNWTDKFDRNRLCFNTLIEEAVELVRAEVIAELENPNAPVLRELVYLEDEQMYFTTPHIFQTDCPWPVSKISRLSWQIPGAGRISTSYGAFMTIMLAYGFRCKLVAKLEKNAQSPEGYEVVEGATGNY